MRYVIPDFEDLRQKVARMDVQQLIHTVCCPSVSPEYYDGKEIKNPFIFFFACERDIAKNSAAKMCEMSGENKIILTDLEYGTGRMIKNSTVFPSLLAFGKSRDEKTVYDIGYATAREAGLAGYRLSLAPCVDIMLDHTSPMASIRCSGESPDEVITCCGAYMRGMQDGGLAATAKHFPGDGATAYDQHLTTSENPLSWSEWLDSYGKVYKDLIENGIKCVMPGHISLPCYDEPDKHLAICPPATLSEKIMTDLLKNELGFGGLVISDAVNMGGFCGFMNYYEACARFLRSGGDLLLFADSNPVFVEKLTELVKNNSLPIDTLRERAYRVLCFKRDLESCDITCYSEDSEALAKKITYECIETVRDRNALLPVSKSGLNVLHVVLSNYNNDEYYFDSFNGGLKKYAASVDVVDDPGPDRLREFAQSGQYDLIVCSISANYMYGTNVTMLHGPVARNMMSGWTKMGTPVVFVNLYQPNFDEQYKAQADTVINTYGVCHYTAQAVLDHIFGKRN